MTTTFISLDDPTLQPGPLAALGLRDEKRRWARSHPHGIEYYAFTARGSERHGNEDAWWTHTDGTDEGGTQYFGVFDEISQKLGVPSLFALDTVVRTVAATDGGVSERLHAANAALWQRLQQAPTVAGTPVQAGACAALVAVSPRGAVQWAAVGDCAVVIQRRARPWWLRNVREAFKSQQNATLHVLHGTADCTQRLTAALGCAPVTRIETGTTQLRPGDRLWLGSDGARLANVGLGLGDGDGVLRNPSLQTAVESTLTQARLTHQSRDDTTLMVIQRSE
jgi:serine/threonine protein phosphatase PrpC